MSEHLKYSFPPIASAEIEILILGSIPGDRSIAENEYYGHPRNRFWRMLAGITDSPMPVSYADKKELLLRNRIGLWDVAHQAIRRGSLDSAIQQPEPNDIASFIERHPKLKVIAFNGRKAEALYKQFFSQSNKIQYFSMPSTSPANAGITFDQLRERWGEIISLLRS